MAHKPSLLLTQMRDLLPEEVVIELEAEFEKYDEEDRATGTRKKSAVRKSTARKKVGTRRRRRGG